MLAVSYILGPGMTFPALRFAGQSTDEMTPFFYNYYRDYDPFKGTYLQSDPIGLAGGVNTYAYVENNPLRYVDPLGLDVHIGFSSTAVFGAGHVGASTTPVATFGFYSKSGAPFGRGEARIDAGMDAWTTIPAGSASDRQFDQCLLKRMRDPSYCSGFGRNCKDFVVECLGVSGLVGSQYDSLLPKDFFCKVAKKYGCEGEGCDVCN